ncbi:hypothetical protein IWW36_000742 [Coemansia brasiliensis]|uniref:Uncharacterized protein n=1 Tax=Coemansia brasiliensis TaxID=2650707 RepID=A0A9W8IAF2_9FUNG|nr:hypothetical protein IWW36_000742 [Coemansia brasiliensis]
MFMPGPPEITPEQQAAMRRDVAKGVLSFVSVIATIRVVPWAIEHMEKLLA